MDGYDLWMTTKWLDDERERSCRQNDADLFLTDGVCSFPQRPQGQWRCSGEKAGWLVWTGGRKQRWTQRKTLSSDPLLYFFFPQMATRHKLQIKLQSLNQWQWNRGWDIRCVLHIINWYRQDFGEASSCFHSLCHLRVQPLLLSSTRNTGHGCEVRRSIPSIHAPPFYSILLAKNAS